MKKGVTQVHRHFLMWAQECMDKKETWEIIKTSWTSSKRQPTIWASVPLSSVQNPKSSFIIDLWQIVISKDCKREEIAEDGFDPSTSGLWAQHASAAPLCFRVLHREERYRYFCQPAVVKMLMKRQSLWCHPPGSCEVKPFAEC